MFDAITQNTRLSVSSGVEPRVNNENRRVLPREFFAFECSGPPDDKRVFELVSQTSFLIDSLHVSCIDFNM